MSVKSKINRNVYLLGFLSFFNDFAADMITPLLPAYLATMGLGAGFLGLMEGLANSLSNITMLFSGWYSDRHHNHKSMAMWGYRLCAFIRPLLAIPLPILNLLVRLVDRFGKGIRSAPRDHLITAYSEKKNWGQAFGVHRSMDHAGSLLGPPLAAWLLSVYSLKLSTLFFAASLPAIISILWIPSKLDKVPPSQTQKLTSPKLSWKSLPLPLKRYSIVMFLAALSTPSELFLILKMQNLGLISYQIPLAWSLLTIFAMLAAYLGGLLADFWSRRRTMALGWGFFTCTYFGFAFNTQLKWAWILIAFHGFQMGLVESSERAYPARVVPESMRSTALGVYSFSYGMGLLPASLLFGLIWKILGSKWAFLIDSGLTLATLPFLLLYLPSDRAGKTSEIISVLNS